MIVDETGERDLVALVVAKVGSVSETGDVWEPYRLSDQTGTTVAAVAAFLNELQASGRSAATQRSYAMDLLRWFRFLLCTSQVVGRLGVSVVLAENRADTVE
jgi:hypothetical protein